MRGHDTVIAMRQKRVKPLFVSVLAMPADDAVFRYPDEKLPDVEIVPGENLQRLDLRFLVGLRVHVLGYDHEHVSNVVQACKDAGANVEAVCG